MDEAELKSAVKYEIERAESYIHGDVNPDRQKALQAYRADPYGDEVEGRSKHVATDVQDTIEAMLPELLRPYLSAGKIGEFQPTQPEDDAFCEQATDYVHHCFVTDNKGDEQLYIAFQDALLEKTGIFKAWWQEEEKVEETEHSGLNELQLVDLLTPEEGEEIEILGQEEGEDGLWSIRIKRTWTDGRLATDVIPPDEFFVSPECRNDLDKANCCGQRRTATYSDLIAEGYPKAKLDEIPSGDDAGDDTNDVRHNNRFQGGGQDSDSPDPSRREITVYEAYIRMDHDGDGIAELRRVVCGGNAYTILENEAVDQHPYSLTCPSWTSHKIIGKAVADLVRDIQRLRTVIIRQMLDNLYLANNPQKEVNVDRIANMDDVLTSRIGGIIRSKKELGAVREIVTPFTASASFPMLEYIDKIKEERSGVSRNSQGLNPDILQNVTATAVAQVTQGSQSRLEMISRVLAWGVKSHFKKMLRVIVNHQDKARTVRLRNKWVDVDPRHWNAEMDCVVNVGLGAGTRERDMMVMQQVMGLQQTLLQGFGPDNPFVKPENISNALSRLVESAGLKTPSLYFTEPDPAEVQQQLEALRNKPDPEREKLQAQMMIEDKKIQANRDKENAQMQADLRVKAAEQQVTSRENAEQRVIEREKIASNERIKAAELAQKRELELLKQGMVQPDGSFTNLVPDMGPLVQSMQVIMEQIGNLQAAQSAPKRVIRDENGDVIGVETVTD